VKGKFSENHNGITEIFNDAIMIRISLTATVSYFSTIFINMEKLIIDDRNFGLQ
jgi:hypothetical protein